MGYLSCGAFKLLKECPACFWWQVKHGIKRLNSWESNLPNVLETEILNNKFLKYRNNGTLPPEFDATKSPELNGFKLIDLETHTRWKDFRSGEPYYQNLSANPDDVLVKDGKHVVCDIKTMGKLGKNCTEESMLNDIEAYNYKFQLEFYTYIIKMSGKDVSDYGYILFYYIDGIDDKSFIYKHKLIKVNLDLNNVPPLVKEAEGILLRSTPPDCRCRFCSSNQQRYDEAQKKMEILMGEVVNLRTFK